MLYLRSKSNLSKRESRWVEFLADFPFSTHHVPGRNNPAGPLSRQAKELDLEMNNIEISIDLNPDFAKDLSEGYADDPELSHIIKRLKSSSRDVFHDRYVWDEGKQRLYLIESSPVRLCVLHMCVVLSLAAYVAHLFSHKRTHPLISVICTMCTLEALDILPLKTSLCSVSNLIFSQLHVSSRCEFLEI